MSTPERNKIPHLGHFTVKKIEYYMIKEEDTAPKKEFNQICKVSISEGINIILKII